MCKILLTKSEENKQAAELLQQEQLFASSVHCSYYRSYQLMNYVLYEYCNVLEADYLKSVDVNNAGSHNNLIVLIREKLYEKNEQSVLEFEHNFRDLKKLRKNADYTQIKILAIDSKKAIQNSEKVCGIIRKTFII